MSGERRAVEAGRRLDRNLSGRVTTDTASDPYMTGWKNQLEFGADGPSVEFGVVVDVVPGAHCYRVSLGHKSYVYCSTGGPDASFGPAGVRPTHTLPLLTRVFVLRDPETPTLGTIVSAEPHWSVHTGHQPADSIWPFTRSGLAVEPAHRFPFEASATIAASNDVNVESIEGADVSAGRPFDGTCVGEWGRQAETGVGVHVDPFCAYLRADEATGVFAFYEDQVLRVAGANYQFLSSVEEVEQFDDEGELGGWRRGCVYTWEQYGLFRYNQVTPGWAAAAVDNHGLAGGQGSIYKDPFTTAAGTGYAVREPEYAGQISAARLHDWSGYLGQGGHSVVAAPTQLSWAYPLVDGTAARAAVVDYAVPDGAPSGRLQVNGTVNPGTQGLAVPPNTYDGPAQPGLIEEHRSLSGRYTLRTARGFVLAKRASIPVPRPVRQPADPDGDRAASNYHAAGLNANAVAHDVTADPTPTTDSGRRMCLLPDAIAYLFNWEALHPFAYHTRDWSVAQEGAAGSVLVNQIAPTYTDLETLDALPAPNPVYVDVDHRYGFTEVYENESLIAVLDDGSIVLRDGWGSEIRMGGGHIELRCPGDVRLHSGRDVAVWGGYDVVLKAHNSVDVTAANGDVRTKAEFNNFNLAGNSGCGGFVFESKAQCPSFNFAEAGQDAVSSGFVVRCPASTIDMVAADVRVALDATAPAEARIVLDAGNSRSVYSRGKQIVNRVGANGGIVHLYSDGAGALHRVDEFRDAAVIIDGPLYVKNKVYVDDCLTVNGWVSSAVHFASDQSGSWYGRVGVDAAVADLASTLTAELETRVTYLTATYGTAWDAQTFPAPNVGSAEFTCRTAAQYLSTEYVFWRSHWEAVADAAAQTLTAWSEPQVIGTVSSTVTRPYPGEERWPTSSTYKYQSYTFVDPSAGWCAVDRDGLRATYESGSPAAASSGTLAALYKVSVPHY